jgi:hypothetical protein
MLALGEPNMTQGTPRVQPNIVSKLMTRYGETLHRELSERNVD